MQRHIARTPIKYLVDGEEKIVAPGRTVPQDVVDDGLVALGAIEFVNDDELFHADTSIGQGSAGGDREVGKPLSRMTKAELLTAAAGVDLDVPDGLTNAALVELLGAALAKPSSDPV